MKYFTLLCIVSILLSTHVFATNGNLGGGTGHSSAPYLIEDIEDFHEFCSDSGYWAAGKYTELTADLDLSEHPYTTAPIAPRGDGTLPVFEGHFDGNSNVITGLTIDGGAFLGLFGRSGTESTLSNIVLEGGSITSTSGICGAVCGECYAYVTGCVSSVSVSGDNNIGGICGTLRSTSIANCYSSGQISSIGNNVGGIFGAWDKYISGTYSVSNCHSTGDVIGDSTSSGRVGGICGKNSYVGEILNCSSTGDISGWRAIGGICGENFSAVGNIENCFSTGNIHSNSNTSSGFGGTGGICGRLENYSSSSNANIVNCYSTGNVYCNLSKTNSNVGGICGYSSGGNIINCYAAGQVSGASSEIGGVCGSLFYTGNFTAGCFWNTNATGSSITGIGNRLDSGVTGITTAQMQTLSTFTNQGWDFVNESANGNDDIWFMLTEDYPKLSWQAMASYDSDPEISLPIDEIGTVEFEIYNPVDRSINWAITGQETCPWITGVTASSGTLAGISSRETIVLSIDAAGLDYGDYTYELTLTTDGAGSVLVPVSLTVYNRVDMEEFAILAQYWHMDNCAAGQPCSDADWFTDGSIDILDLQQLAISWMGSEIIYDADGFSEGFESGDFSMFDWEIDVEDSLWEITSDEVYEGNYASRSGAPDSDGEVFSSLDITIDTQEYNTISFYRKQIYGYFEFYMYGLDNGYEVFSDSDGNTDWVKEEYTFPPGEYEIYWFFYGWYYDDALWLDNINFSSTDVGGGPQ